MLSKEKTNTLLGEYIHQWLVSNKVESPFFFKPPTDSLFIYMERFLEGLGIDLTNDSVKKTPKRMEEMYVNELFWGMRVENFPAITTIENEMGYNEMVIERNISVKSMCEHHFLPFIGVAHVAYIPDKKIIGLSKLNRVVEYFSRRPQVQERLSEQVYFALSYILETDNIAVVVNASHLCVKMRGVEDTNSDTITTKLGGVFYDSPQRAEFFSSLKL